MEVAAIGHRRPLQEEAVVVVVAVAEDREEEEMKARRLYQLQVKRYPGDVLFVVILLILQMLAQIEAGEIFSHQIEAFDVRSNRLKRTGEFYCYIVWHVYLLAKLRVE